jgi:hypothetical protein
MANYGLQQIFPDQLTDTNASAVNALGTVRFENGNRYLYVQNGNASTTLADQACCTYMAAGDYTVTPKTVAKGPVAGVAICDIAASYYGWIQTGGFADCTNRASDVDDGVIGYCIGTTGVIAAVDSTAQAGDMFYVGYGVADATSNVAKIYIDL